MRSRGNILLDYPAGCVTVGAGIWTLPTLTRIVSLIGSEEAWWAGPPTSRVAGIIPLMLLIHAGRDHAARFVAPAIGRQLRFRNFRCRSIAAAVFFRNAINCDPHHRPRLSPRLWLPSIAMDLAIIR
jgi:hypothetical protein